MNQIDYDVICISLRRGVPVLAESLINAINVVLNDNKRMQDKIKELENKVEKKKENK